MISGSQFNKQTPTEEHADNVIVDIDSDKIPNIDENSLDFLKRIVRNDMRVLEFEDNLTIYSLSGVEIGNFQISVSPVIYKRSNCFKIKAKSYGVVDDVPCGTEVNAFVNEKLETIDQDYYEFLKLQQGQLDRRIIISLESENEYRVSKSDNTQKRLMIQNNKIEPINLFTFDTEMNPSIVSYRPLDSRVTKIEDKDFKIKGIERTIESISDIPTTWQIYFSSDGHMINRVQIGYPAVMKATTKPKPIEIDEYLPKITIEKKQLEWEKDMQMNSNYLDRKEDLKNDYEQYLNDHPELRQLVADFMQSVLSLKPKDTLGFASKHFAPYSAKTRSNKLLTSLNQETNIPKH